MKTLYILGAGASKSNPYCFPVMNELYRELRKRMSKTERDKVDGQVYEVMNEEIVEGSDIRIDFEDFLNKLNPDSLTYVKDLKEEPSPRRVATEICLRVLREYMLSMCQEKQNSIGPYDVLARSLKHGDIIVSFNWDVIVENALRRNSRTYSYLPQNDVEITLLKPHGSINWFALLDREGMLIDINPDLSNIRLFGSMKYYMCYLDDPLGGLDFGSTPEFTTSRISKFPAIIPPTHNKLLDVGGNTVDEFVDDGHKTFMKNIWRIFREVIEGANRIIAIGYSLPGEDAASLKVIKDFSPNGIECEFGIIDLSDGIVERYQRIVNPNIYKICDYFEDYNPEANK